MAYMRGHYNAKVELDERHTRAISTHSADLCDPRWFLIIDLDSKSIVGGEPIRCDSVHQVTISPCGRFVLMLPDRKNAAMIIDAAVGRFRAVGLPHECSVRALRFSPDGNICATGDEKGAVRLWRSEGGELLAKLKFDKKIDDLVFSDDGASLLTVSRAELKGPGAIRLWDLASGKPCSKRIRSKAPFSHAALSHDEQHLIGVTGDKYADMPSEIRVLSLKGKPVHPVMTEGVIYEDVIFREDRGFAIGRFWGSGSPDSPSGHATVWDLTTGARVGSTSGEGSLCSMALSNDSKMLATINRAGRDSEVKIWSTEDLSTICTIDSLQSASCINFSSDGRRVCVGHAGVVSIYDLGLESSDRAPQRAEEELIASAPSTDKGTPREMPAPGGGDLESLEGSEAWQLRQKILEETPLRKCCEIPASAPVDSGEGAEDLPDIASLLGGSGETCVRLLLYRLDGEPLDEAETYDNVLQIIRSRAQKDAHYLALVSKFVEAGYDAEDPDFRWSPVPIVSFTVDLDGDDKEVIAKCEALALTEFLEPNADFMTRGHGFTRDGVPYRIYSFWE